MHSVHFHGQILLTLGRHTDTVSMFPGSSTTAQMTADNPGHWLLTCTVNDHLMGRRLIMMTLELLLGSVCVQVYFLCLLFRPGGMQALFEIRKCFPNVHKPRPFGEVRPYFIAAEEEVWDYAPTAPEDGSVAAHGICIHCVFMRRWQHIATMSVFFLLGAEKPSSSSPEGETVSGVAIRKFAMLNTLTTPSW